MQDKTAVTEKETQKTVEQPTKDEGLSALEKWQGGTIGTLVLAFAAVLVFLKWVYSTKLTGIETKIKDSQVAVLVAIKEVKDKPTSITAVSNIKADMTSVLEKIKDLTGKINSRFDSFDDDAKEDQRAIDELKNALTLLQKHVEIIINKSEGHIDTLGKLYKSEIKIMANNLSASVDRLVIELNAFTSRPVPEINTKPFLELLERFVNAQNNGKLDNSRRSADNQPRG